ARISHGWAVEMGERSMGGAMGRRITVVGDMRISLDIDPSHCLIPDPRAALPTRWEVDSAPPQPGAGSTSRTRQPGRSRADSRRFRNEPTESGQHVEIPGLMSMCQTHQMLTSTIRRYVAGILPRSMRGRRNVINGPPSRGERFCPKPLGR